MTNIVYQVKGIDRVKKALNRIRAKVKNLKGAWPQIRDEFYRIEQKRFDSQNKGRWKPLSPRYASWKEANHPGKPIMVLTGDLKRTLTSLTSGSIYNPTPNSLTLGTSKKYALTHQHGRGKIPARPLIALISSDLNRFKTIMKSYLNTVIGKNR